MSEDAELGIGLFLIIILFVCLIWDIGLVTYSYLNADEIKCNWLWCEFTQERTTIESRSECYTNGVRVNCSDMGDFSDMVDLIETFK